MNKTNLDTAYKTITTIAKEFKAHQHAYLSASYTEAQTRHDFIDKFLIAMGWDVHHDHQKNPFEQEVKVERNVAVEHSQRRADYAFYVAPNFRDVRLFVEAKKPTLTLATKDNYFQTIRYGWNSQTPLAVLTDFYGLHILDCRYRPDIDTALDRAIRTYTLDDYEDRVIFSEIYFLISREALISGGLERFANELPTKRGTPAQRRMSKGIYQTIDDAFLEELDTHRETLARSFKNCNPSLDGETLTEITQRTLDRLVFLRFLEDKLIETKERVASFGRRADAWTDFVGASRRLNSIYNGIVFKHHKLLDSDSFIVDNDTFSSVCDKLSHVNSPYDFNTIPIHILGSIYERFLGKIIVTTDKRARVEEKPEVRKAGGVYYTPEYIVRYIVDRTIIEQIKDKSPQQIAKMHFADVACGSGSFLLGIYDCLLRHHRTWYNANRDRVRAADVFESEDGTLHLTLSKKREILLNNIYGVDIDAQAVEVAQLALYLKLLEEETTASGRNYQLELHQTILPSLSQNVLCGNSLISTDILTSGLFPPSDERRINAFDFGSGFQNVMKAGGFDAIVGNPPYGAYLHEGHRDYLRSHYTCQSYQLDSYLLFMERALRDLIKSKGFFGMIIPNPWLTNLLQGPTRRFVVESHRVQEIVHFRFPVFPKVTVDTEIVILQKASPSKWKPIVTIAHDLPSFEQGLEVGLERLEHDQASWRKLNGGVINIFLSKSEETLAAKIASSGVPLEQLLNINVGIKPYQVGKGTPPQTRATVDTRPFDSERKESPLHRKYLRGGDIVRYAIVPQATRYLKFGPWLAEPRPAANFDAPIKLLVRQTGDSLVSAIDNSQFLCLNNLHILVPRNNSLSLWFLLALVNSKLMNWYYHTLNPEVGEALAEVKRANVARLPIALPEAGSDLFPLIKRIAKLSEQMAHARTSLSTALTDKDRTYFGQRGESMESQLDALVYHTVPLDHKRKNVN